MREVSGLGKGGEERQKMDECYLSVQLQRSQENLPWDGFGCWEGGEKPFGKQ